MASHPWYSTRLWQQVLRPAVIRRDKGRCQDCKTLVVDAPNEDRSPEVDHIERFGEDWELFKNMDNLQLLCRTCHTAKTMKERGHRPKHGHDAKGRPLDPEHPWNQ